MKTIPVELDDDDKQVKNMEFDDGEIKMKKSIGLLSSITIIVGSVIGSGIFVSPNGILEKTSSPGGSLLVWVFCGVFSLFGAYSYAELGAMIPRSGADYSYVLEAFGPFFAFLRLWVEVLVVRPVSAAVIAIVFARYMIHPIFPSCEQPELALHLLALLCILIVSFINAISVRLATRTQDVFTFAKVIALVLIIVTGFVQLARGHTEAFQEPFEGTNWNPADIAVSIYTGLFAYSGWNYLNNMIEEMKNPRRDLPIAIVFSCLLITTIYTLANVAYMSVLSIPEILDSSAVAVTFATRIYGSWWWIMPIFVAFSTFGGVNGTIMTTSRIYFVAAQENQMPKLLSFLHVDRLTPIPAVFFTCIASIVYVLIGNVNSLIAYLGFVQWFAIGVSVFIVILFRWTRPHLKRPVRVPIVLSYLFLAVTLFLIIFSFVGSPRESLMGVAITATGIPFYFIGCVWKNKPKAFMRQMNSFTIGAQKLMRIVPGS